PLIVVNCIVLGRAEAFASKNPVFPSLLDGLGMGLGFTLASDKVNRLNKKKLDQLKLDAESAFSQDFALKEKFEYLLSIQPKKKGFFGLFR
ncbi:MAG: hypothetical protein II777_03380, partial [Clostridia bacterium]|nr:hypothetical protein [Clostridia bacterium]